MAGGSRKISVSIPEELLDEAQRRHPQYEGMSALIQAALRAWLGEGRPGLGQLKLLTPPEDREAIIEKLRQDAQAAYQDGYNEGTNLARRMSFDVLELFASAAYDLKQWKRMLGVKQDLLSPISGELSRPPAIEGLTEEDSRAFWYAAEEWAPTRRRGCTDALKEFYEGTLAMYEDMALEQAYDDYKHRDYERHREG